MKTLLKKCFRSLPAPARNFAGGIYGAMKAARARRAFDGCSRPAAYLEKPLLDALMAKGYDGPGAIRYDAEGLELRAQEKIAWIRSRVPLESLTDCLELGCFDGMVGYELRKIGKKAYGLDINKDDFDDRARQAGVQFIHGDVARMPVGDATMDLVYSFAAFEHFPDPDAVISESLRVLRPGGYLYLSFGPVYTSPYGRHAYRQIPVPYCHYLFSENDLETWARAKGLPVKWPFVNGVSVTAYRELWKKYAEHVENRYYKEHPTGGVGAELIEAYPFCFKGRVPDFGDLLVSAIELVWRKK